MKIKFPDWSQMDSLYPGAKRLSGSTQLTFLWHGNVYQFPPELCEPLPLHVMRVISRWMPPHKASLIVERNAEVHLLTSSEITDKVIVPAAMLHEQGCRLEYFDECVTLEQYVQSHADTTNRMFRICVEFLRRLHEIEFGVRAKTVRQQLECAPNLLQEYYIQRLNDIILILGEQAVCHIHRDKLLSIGDMAADHLEHVHEAVSADERIRVVHGDYNPSGNLLVTRNRQVLVIDMEQGLLGGDPIADLRSLRLWDTGPRLKKLLPGKDQKELRLIYGDLECVPTLRSSLIRFDRLVSALIFKLLIEENEGGAVQNRPLAYRPAEEAMCLILHS